MDPKRLQRKLKQINLKRKHHSSEDRLPAKKRKLVEKHDETIEDLEWKEVTRPSAAGIDEAGGMLMLEEVEDVEVIWEETSHGRVAKFKKIDKPKIISSKEPEIGYENEHPSLDEDESGNELESSSFNASTQLPEWSSFDLKPILLSQIHNLGFLNPTPIQKETFPFALNGRDVIGIAQTGSGKTLAFALPILNSILSFPTPKKTKRKLKAMILTPTRELALQVSKHIQDCSPSRTEAQIKAHHPPRVSIVTIVGGMSAQKQARLLKKGVDIIVGTPGRLWELLSMDDEFVAQVKQMKFLVLDEADRMIENGHFAELENIIRLTERHNDEAEEGVVDVESKSDNPMQTFVFSATMSKDLQRNLKRWKQMKNKDGDNTIDALMSKLDFRDPAPEVVDLSPKDGLVASFQESKVECLTKEKDIYLYYFLLRYPGRSLVFLSAIDGIRRLTPVLEHLKIKVWPLHSQLEQKQRLKNLDRFKITDKCVLLATDVAARGLDIPFVDHVIHYQVPRSADIYVHRNGRTARAERPGFGLLLCGPDERKLIRGLLNGLQRRDDEILDLPVERQMLDKLKIRVQLAQEIDKIQHTSAKQTHEKNWLKATAEALEIELEDEETTQSSHATQVKLKSLKNQLASLLSEPLLAKGVSAKFITSGNLSSLVDDLIQGKNHDTMLGFKPITAQDDVLGRKENSKGKRLVKKN